MTRADILTRINDGTLRQADLTGADLTDFFLVGMDFSGLDLTEADFTRSNLSSVNFQDSKLHGARFTRAKLLHANLDGANLSLADLYDIKKDVFRVLQAATACSQTVDELVGLKAAIDEGRVSGTLYEGECCCLVGTLARGLGVHFRQIPGIYPSLSNPAETFFFGIKVGDTPETSQLSEIASDWVREYIAIRKFELHGLLLQAGEG